MTRKNHTLRGIFQFFGVLTVLMGVAALTQVKGVGQAYAKPHAVSVPLFLPVVAYNSGGSFATSVATADVNGDGKPDLVVANCVADGSTICGTSNGIVGVLLGNGDGTFQPAMTYGTGGLGGAVGQSVAIADVNGDGKPDVLVANLFSNTIGVLLGNGDGTFQLAMTYDSGGVNPFAVAVADVNGDGKPDLVAANANTDSVGVLLGNGDGTFQTAVTYGGFNAESLAIADVNGDGKPDLVVAGGVTVVVLLNNGDGTFQSAVSYASGGFGPPDSVAIADVNGDGKPDLVVSDCAADEVNGCGATSANGTVGILLGNGDGTFQPVVVYDSGGKDDTSVAVADVNGDGKPDVVVTHGCDASGDCGTSTVSVLPGNGDGTFQPAVVYNSGPPAGGGAFGVAVADVNGDGKPDLLVANGCAATTCASSTVGVLLNNTPDTTPPVITLAATPKILWPPNGKMVPVMISGKITDTGSGVNASSAEFAVQDEYHLVQPRGKITLDAAGNYSFTILLRASRKGNDPDGRQYTIGVNVRDNAGNRGAKWTRVTVPHDLR